MTLESDKATMDVPSSAAGVVKELKVKVGDNVSEGTLIVVLDGSGGSGASSGAASVQKAEEKPAEKVSADGCARGLRSGGSVDVKVPDIGDFKDIPVIEINVKVGDKVEKEQSLVTLESDKATMDVPSPEAGTVKEIKVKRGRQRVGRHADSSCWKAVLPRLQQEAPKQEAPKQEAPKQEAPKQEADAIRSTRACCSGGEERCAVRACTSARDSRCARVPKTSSHASPSVRKFARELGVDVSQVTGYGSEEAASRKPMSPRS